MPSSTVGNSEDALAYLDAVVPAMRRLGVREFAGLVLDPEPTLPDQEDPTERKLSAAEIQQQLRDNRKRIALGASGGPVKRIFDPTRP